MGEVVFLGTGHLECSRHLTFNDLTVHNYNILNTAQHFQLLTVPSTPKKLQTCQFLPYYHLFAVTLLGAYNV